MATQRPAGAPHPPRPPHLHEPVGREVWRWSYDTIAKHDIVQVGLTILVDGERRVSVWEDVGPFDSVADAEIRCGAAALRLFCSQLELFPET